MQKNWIFYFTIILTGLILAVSPLFRFSWDIASQSFIHIASIILLILFVNNYKSVIRVIPHVPVLIFFLFGLISIISNSNKACIRDNLLILGDSLIISYISSFLSEKQKKRLLLIPVFIGFWFSITLIFCYLFSSSFHNIFIPNEIVINENILAGYLLLCLPLSFIIWETNFKSGILLSLMLIAGIFLTKSRIAVFVSLCLIGYYILYFKKNLKRAGICILFLIIASFLFLVYHKIQSNSITDRLIWWQSALKMFIQNPFNGIGWGNFGSYYLNCRISQSLNTYFAHNIFLQMLAETGAQGILAFISILYFIYKKNNKDIFNVSIILSITGFLLFNLFDYSFYIPSNMLLFWFLTGLNYSFNLEARTKPLLSYSGIIICVFCINIILFLPFLGNYYYGNGLFFMKHADYINAKNEFQKSIIFDAMPYEPYNKLAETYFKLYILSKDKINLDKSISYELEAIKRYSINAKAWSDLSWLYFHSGEREKALEAMRNAAKFDKFNPNYKKMLKDLNEVNIK